ncbi:MAG TPA: cyclopropane-fatty-acyl-phospholipid synthase family protein [Bryobacteraceae bacterium]|nr:cyclopropane-fatty-acyl-phospholipid synthase family protein [Bryobacteraceae bacterium]
MMSAANAFVRGEFDIRGDMVAAVRFKRASTGSGGRPWFETLLLYLRHLRTRLATRMRTTRDIRFHYDRSNDFYRLFLDSRMVYSCAYFRNSEWSLDRAQLEKLDHICRKLDLQPGDRFLDIGCGWGSLLLRAAGSYGVLATGCTLSENQAKLACRLIEARRLGNSASVRLADYRKLTGPYDKIASVGMFEHVGPIHLEQYFRTVYRLLDNSGLFLNHGIIRPEGVREDAETLFIDRYVFPGGGLSRLAQTVRTAERAGFELLDAENLRCHYGMTCRAWLERLLANRNACLEAVDRQTYRTWLIYLAGSAANFEDGGADVFQLLFAKRTHPRPRRMSRDHMYEPVQR